MVNIRAVKNYIVENGEYEKSGFLSETSYILDLGNDYSIEYSIPARVKYPDYITIRKGDFTQEFKGDAILSLDMRLWKYNSIYEVIDYYKRKYDREQVDRQLELEELEKFMGRG